ncbi:AAA family ATPase [Psittacicella hinzii]|uniref:AAA+ ATPase domain-containing protein n=1 Tax=Psittacicella hinzii TaxID=2028575 RepID=A0A3A1YKB4_9GAMM|nr:AAA family ATPase [Psittacicella hinzii]RIY37480.1 hypothetical protein CKF58_04990 [Psittacicella hinzii]
MIDFSKYQTAEQIKKPLKAAFVGESGAGKTYGALALADAMRRLSDNPENFYTLIIDSEAGASSIVINDMAYKNMLIKGIPDNQLNYNVIKETITQAIADGFKLVVIDSISPAWSGLSGLYGSAVAATKGSIKMQTHAVLANKQNENVSYFQNLDIPLIFTIKEKRTVNVEEINGRQYYTPIDKIDQKKGFEFFWDLILEQKRKGYQFPNGAIATQVDVADYALSVNQPLATYVKANNLVEINNVTNVEKSRIGAFQQGKVIKLTKLDYVKLCARAYSLTTSALYDDNVPQLFFNGNRDEAIAWAKENKDQLNDFDKRALKYLFDF